MAQLVEAVRSTQIRSEAEVLNAPSVGERVGTGTACEPVVFVTLCFPTWCSVIFTTSLLDLVILQCFTHLHTSTSSYHTHANYFQTPPCQFYLLPSLLPCDDILVLSSLLYIFPNCYISLSARFDAPSHDSSYLIRTPRPLVRLQHASIIHDRTKRILGISALSYTGPRLLVTPALECVI